MSHIARFAEYAQAFELSYLDDDWSRIEPFLDPDIVYEICDVSFACRLVGRDAVLHGIRKALNGFDRRCQRQIIHIAGPAELGDQVLTYGMATFAHEDAPLLAIRMHETVRYSADRIVQLTDVYDPGMDERVQTWCKHWARDLDPSYA